MLPDALTRYFADSRLTLESFSSQENMLTLRIEKEIGPETGIILFGQVSFLSLPVVMSGDGIKAQPVREASSAFWSRSLMEKDFFEADDVLFELYDQEGQVYFVVAKSVKYQILQ